MDEKLAENAENMGILFRKRLEETAKKCNLITQVRGKGLLNAIVLNDTEDGKMGWKICMELAENGLLAKPTHGNKIRFAPPLIITEKQMNEACDIIEKVVLGFEK